MYTEDSNSQPEAVPSQNPTVVPKMLSFTGRVGRLRYLAYSFAVYFLGVLTIAISRAVGSNFPNLSILFEFVNVVVFVAIILHLFSLVKRRLNDADISGLAMFLVFVPIANLLLAFILLFWPGTSGVNRYGPQPVKNSFGVALLGFVVLLALLNGGMSE